VLVGWGGCDALLHLEGVCIPPASGHYHYPDIDTQTASRAKRFHRDLRFTFSAVPAIKSDDGKRTPTGADDQRESIGGIEQEDTRPDRRTRYRARG